MLRERLGGNIDEHYVMVIVAAGSVFADSVAG